MPLACTVDPAVDGSGPAFAAAALWAVLPLSTEAVTNIVGRADLLAAGAVLGGLLIYLKSRDAHGAARAGWLAALAAITAIGAFSKESAVAIVAVIVVYELIWRPRATTIQKKPRSSQRAQRNLFFANVAHSAVFSDSLGPAIAAAAPPLVMWAQRAAVLAASPAAEWPFVDNPITGAGFWTGRLTALTVIGRDLWLMIWPIRLSCDYSYAQIPIARGSIDDWMAWATAAAAVAVVGIAALARRRTLLFFAAFTAITLLPSSNLLVLSGTIMAERLLYLPSLGVVAALVVAAFAACRTRTTAALPLLAVGIVIAGAIAAGTARTWARMQTGATTSRCGRQRSASCRTATRRTGAGGGALRRRPGARQPRSGDRRSGPRRRDPVRRCRIRSPRFTPIGRRRRTTWTRPMPSPAGAPAADDRRPTPRARTRNR